MEFKLIARAGRLLSIFKNHRIKRKTFKRSSPLYSGYFCTPPETPKKTANTKKNTANTSSMVAHHKLYYDHDFMSCFRVRTLYKRKVVQVSYSVYHSIKCNRRIEVENFNSAMFPISQLFRGNMVSMITRISHFTRVYLLLLGIFKLVGAQHVFCIFSAWKSMSFQ